MSADRSSVNFPSEISSVIRMLEEYHSITGSRCSDMVEVDQERESMLVRSQEAMRNLKSVQQASDRIISLRSEINKCMIRAHEIESNHLNLRNSYAAEKQRLRSELTYIEKEYASLQEKLANLVNDASFPSTISAKETRNGIWLDLVGPDEYHQDSVIHQN